MLQSRSKSKSARFGRMILRLVNIAVALLTVATAYGGLVDPRQWALPAFAVMIFPVMALICVALLIADLFMSRLMALWMVGALLCCFGPLQRTFPLNLASKTRVEQAPKDREFTFMTYNVYNMTDVSGLPDSINGIPFHSTLNCIVERDPDIACLQEAKPIKWMRGSYPQLVDTLMSRYPYEIDSDGHVFLSRYPIERVATGIERGESFVVAAVKAQVEGHELYVVSVHMQSIGLTAGDKALYRELTDMETSKANLREARSELVAKLAAAFRERARQAEALRALVDSLPGNVILSGDFNDVPGCFAVRTVMGRDMRDAYTDGATGYKVTYNHNRFYFRIDHILYRGDLRALRTVRDSNRGSDHYPLITTFEWE